jgi:hypothetical protein
VQGKATIFDVGLVSSLADHIGDSSDWLALAGHQPLGVSLLSEVIPRTSWILCKAVALYLVHKMHLIVKTTRDALPAGMDSV